VFVNISKFKVSVYPQCHLIVPENGWRIVCSGLKKAAANTGNLGTENQYYPSFSSIKQALVARIVNWRGSFSLFVYSLLTQTQDCRCVAYTTFLKNSPLFHGIKYL